ncbi:hypothetical protein B9Z19DRAFT_660709 [Tuber borchii]|uniref:Uncharacterized protein n=1 Tax=Tuber borchii TaxID=42251 RepID=A0A2T6ZZX2_TUBBO|nr:hypothetical protein B9Z19DRAFT_660709 [Tuber borchii]
MIFVIVLIPIFRYFTLAYHGRDCFFLFAFFFFSFLLAGLFSFLAQCWYFLCFVCRLEHFYFICYAMFSSFFLFCSFCFLNANFYHPASSLSVLGHSLVSQMIY